MFIKDENNRIILVYYQPMPKTVNIDGESIVFTPQFGISLGFVKDELTASRLLSYRGGCCGNKRQVIFPATQIQYEHWKFGRGGRKSVV